MEKTPLLTPSFKSQHIAGDNRYLLLSISTHDRIYEETTCSRSLRNLATYSGVIVVLSVISIMVLIIVAVTYHADVTELTNRYNHRRPKLQQSMAEGDTSNLNATQTENVIQVKFPLGIVNGRTRKSRKGRQFVAFYKVPYAKPPVGQLRFKDPQPPESWEGIRDIGEVAPQCIQKSKLNQAVGEEDCLYMNIYVPKVPGGNESLNYPTMVYIHGGGFLDGNGSRYGGEYFMDEDVVLITFQYRLGFFGFLNTGDRESTGNMGFKDQTMVLKWIRDYISYFGGNQNQVTIFGNSGGGFSVNVLMISPMAKGLFHRAISQSGTLLLQGNFFDDKPETTKIAAAKRFNCSTSSSSQFLDCLRGINANDIAMLRTPETAFLLTVEKGFDENNLSDVFMPDNPYNLLTSGKLNDVPYIIGVTATEWINTVLGILRDVNRTAEINDNFYSFLPDLGIDLTPEESDLVKSFYFGDQEIGNNTQQNFTNLISDRTVVHGSKVVADMQSKVSDTFLYYLSKPAAKTYAKNLVDYPDLDQVVVAHSDELQFLFPYSGFPEISVTNTEYFHFSEYIVKLWVNFARTGNPAMVDESANWENIHTNQNAFTWYELNDSPGTTTILQERMDFWDQFSHEKLGFTKGFIGWLV